MVQFMLKMTAALLFGVDDAAFAYRLGALIDRWVHRNHEIGMGALVSSPQFAEGYDDLLLQAEELEQSVREMFQSHRSVEHDRLNILSLLFQVQQSQGQLTDNQLTGHATLLFAAAHLTTAHTFSWTLFLLSQHPDVLQKLQMELSTKVAADIPTLEELDGLPYLDAVIKESMRVLPASSYSQRVAVEPTSLGPVRMNPGTPVIFSQLSRITARTFTSMPTAFCRNVGPQSHPRHMSICRSVLARECASGPLWRWLRFAPL